MTMPNTAIDGRCLTTPGKAARTANQQANVAICVVGLGSSHGDDQVGWLVVEELQKQIATRGFSHVSSHRAGSPVQILDWIAGVERLIVVDACRCLGETGQFSRIRWPTNFLDRLRGGGSHDFSLEQTLELATGLQLLPPLVDVWCVEGSHFEAGQPPCTAVSQAVRVVAQQIAQTIDAT